MSVITRLALRMFSGLSFTVTVSLYSGTRSLSSGRFTYTMPLYREKQGRKHPVGCEEPLGKDKDARQHSWVPTLLYPSIPPLGHTVLLM